MLLKEKVQLLAIGVAVVAVTSFVTVFALKNGGEGIDDKMFLSGVESTVSDTFKKDGTTIAKADSNLDTDEDGLNNKDELEIYKTDPWTPDTDTDRLSDGNEVNVYETDPLEKDTDGDGFYDGVEVANGHDPLDPDPEAMIEIQPGETQPDVFAEMLEATERGEEPDLTRIGELEITEDSMRSLGVQLGADPEDIRGFELPKVSDKEIKIGEDGSKEAVQGYFDGLEGVLYENCSFCSLDGGTKMMSSLEAGNLAAMTEYAEDFDEISSELLELEVSPVQEVVNLHKKGIGFGTAASQTVGDIANLGLTYNGALNSLMQLKGLMDTFQNMMTEVNTVSSMYSLGLPSTNISTDNRVGAYGLDYNNLTAGDE